MAIDSVRLLSDSAAQVWRRLSGYSPIEALSASDCFDDWISPTSRASLDKAEEQALRRDYRRMLNLIEELETLLRSRARAIQMVQARIAEEHQLPSSAA